MATSPRRVSWDAATWIALIQKERIFDASGRLVEDRGMMCRHVVDSAKDGQTEIICSSLCLAEVCKNPGLRNDTSDDEIAAYFEQDYILLVNLDREVGELARKLMMMRYSGLKPPDAVHIATAVVANAEEMHTFDGDVINLNGIIDKRDGSKLKICKPNPGGPPLPLLEKMENG